MSWVAHSMINLGWGWFRSSFVSAIFHFGHWVSYGAMWTVYEKADKVINGMNSKLESNMFAREQVPMIIFSHCRYFIFHLNVNELINSFQINVYSVDIDAVMNKLSRTNVKIPVKPRIHKIIYKKFMNSDKLSLKKVYL